jgi:hypothetical protein
MAKLNDKHPLSKTHVVPLKGQNRRFYDTQLLSHRCFTPYICISLFSNDGLPRAPLEWPAAVMVRSSTARLPGGHVVKDRAEIAIARVAVVPPLSRRFLSPEAFGRRPPATVDRLVIGLSLKGPRLIRIKVVDGWIDYFSLQSECKPVHERIIECHYGYPFSQLA